jgi:hypothetical protein
MRYGGEVPPKSTNRDRSSHGSGTEMPRMSHLSDRGLGRLAAEVLAHAEWFPRTGPGRSTVSIADTLTLQDAVLLWATVPGHPGQPVLLAARQQGERLVPMSTATAMLSLTARAHWPTSAGGTVSWTGPGGDARFVEPVGTTATNDVVRIHLRDSPALLKAYRVVGDGKAEHRALTAAAPGQLVPRVLARIGYRGTGAADEAPLALVTEAVAGQTLDVQLRRSLESAWQTGRSELSAPSREFLRRIRGAVQTLHGCLLLEDLPVRHPLVIRLPDLLADIGVVERFLPEFSQAHRLLDAAARQAAALCASGELVTGGAHGDLHLSHVLVDDSQVRFVDPGSGRAVTPSDDFAALHRAVECLCLDLQVAMIAAGAEHDTASALRAVAWAADPSAQTGSPWEPLIRSAETAASTRVAELWCANVVAELVGRRQDPASKLLYLARLLHDLRYHTERGRTYYADLAWWHLARLLAFQPKNSSGGTMR